MKYVALASCLILAIAIMGCDPVKELDWDRTSRDQHLRIGNRVKVEGVTYGLSLYEFKKSDNPENLWVKKTWGTELDFWVYPDNSINDINPNSPIGTVIGTIYNPMHNETLKELRDTYPDKITALEFPSIKHRFEITGRIHSFQRAVRPTADDTKPDISLTTVRIHVESLKHVESINLKE